jgi:hypothetical protein
MLPAHEEILSFQLVTNNKYARQVRSCAAGLNYRHDTDYKERLIQLNLLPLDVRRNMKDLLFFFKCRAGLLDIQLPDYVQNRPAVKYNFRSYDVNDFKCRTQYFKNSYFP